MKPENYKKLKEIFMEIFSINESEIESYRRINNRKWDSIASVTLIAAVESEFNVVIDCMVCLPVEGMKVECICKTITKAGIHAQVIDDEKNIPITIFIARDHHYLDNKFSEIKEGEKIISIIIGIRFELYDEFICAIGKLV